MSDNSKAAAASPVPEAAATTSDVPALVFNRVVKTFGSKKAVHDVSFSVQKGEVFGFLGPNGAGKSTSIRMMLDVLRPTAGNIRIFGEDSRQAKSAHRRIGYLSGDMVMDSNLTGRQYLEFTAAQYGKDCAQRRDQLAQLLQADLKVKIGQYSRGNRQKIGLIAALQHEPDLLLLDEPTSGFDPLVQEQFADLIQTFKQKGGTVFMSSHILGEVQLLCDRVAFIKDGVIIQTVTVSQLVEHAAKRVCINVPIDQMQALRNRLKALPGVELLPAENDKDVLCTFNGSPNVLIRMLTAFDVLDMTVREQELEEIFMRYYRQQVEQDPATEAHLEVKEITT